MDESHREIARRALKTAIEKLDADKPDSADESGPIVVVVVAPGDRAQRGEGRRSIAIANPGGDHHHPGLDKFPLAGTSASSNGIKTCFMEPDRPCVNSGACELRGY